MRMRAAILALIFCLTAAGAQGAGLREIKIPADARGPEIDATVWTPCAAAPKNIKIEDGLVVPGVRDCPVRGDKLPLIILSHGGGSGPILHHDTAEMLADSGFAVVALHHPNDHAGGLDKVWLVERPTDVKRVLDHVLGPSPLAARIDPRRIGFFGFSRGGYTGLLLAGAMPQYPRFLQIWMKLAIWVLHRDMPPQPLALERRFKAFVIADPLALFFPGKDNLRKVTAPIQLWSSQNGGAGVTPEDVAAVARNLPAKPEFHLVPKSEHSSFAMPCTPQMTKMAPAFCADPPGFDRAVFHRAFNPRVVAFFEKHLGA